MRADSREALKPLLHSILSGSYTPHELREFVGYCYDLALPRIRRLIQLGKLDPQRNGLHEDDVVYDCIADLFRRDEEGRLVHVVKFFSDPARIGGTNSEGVAFSWLRMLVVGKVNNNIVRLYDEADPVLGSVIRNIKIALDREPLFEKVDRFNDTLLVPAGCDFRLHLPPLPEDVAQALFAQYVVVHDSIPVMLRKLHRMLTEVEGYQKGITLVKAALMLKGIVQMRATDNELQWVEPVDRSTEDGAIAGLIHKACQDVRAALAPRYLAKMKCTEEQLNAYMRAIWTAMIDRYGDGAKRGSSYFTYLRKEMPALTTVTYARVHRTRVEYFAREVRGRLRNRLR